jgi:hypothetical protein
MALDIDSKQAHCGIQQNDTRHNSKNATTAYAESRK